ncbi:hypothetical protein ACFQ51_29440 [Streptomyces kaempferi]
MRRLAVGYTLDGVDSLGLLDLADGTFRSYVTGVTTTGPVRFNDRWLVAGNKVARVDAAPGTDPVPVPTYGDYKIQGVVGDQLMLANPSVVFSPDTYRLVGISLADGTRTTVIDNSSGSYTPTLDGGLLATAGPSSADWHVYRVTPTETGATAARVLDVEANRSTIGGMMLSGGELLMDGNVTDQGGYDSVHGVQLDAAGRPAGPQTYRASLLNLSPCLAGDVACPQFEALGDGGFAYLSTGADGKESVHVTGREPNSYAAEPTGASGGRIGTGTGRYVLYNGGTPGVQKVADFPRGADGRTALDRTRTAAAVWGQRLWTPGTSQGSVVGYDLKSGKNVATVATGAPCTPSEIQAVNAWLYWSCGASGPAASTTARPTAPSPCRLPGPARRRLPAPREPHHARTAAHGLPRGVGHHPHGGRAADDRPGHGRQHRPLDRRPLRRQRRLPDRPRPGGDRHRGRAHLAARADGGPDRRRARPDGRRAVAARVAVEQALGVDPPADQHHRHGRPHPHRHLHRRRGARLLGRRDHGGGRAPRGSYTWKLTAEPRDHEGPDLLLTGTATVN